MIFNCLRWLIHIMPKQQRELSLIVLIEYTTFTQLCHRKKWQTPSKPFRWLKNCGKRIWIYRKFKKRAWLWNLWDGPQKICHAHLPFKRIIFHLDDLKSAEGVGTQHFTNGLTVVGWNGPSDDLSIVHDCEPPFHYLGYNNNMIINWTKLQYFVL